MPFLSANVSELWRRWHISLSTWIRDYLFIPLEAAGHALANLSQLAPDLHPVWRGTAPAGPTSWGLLNGILLVRTALSRRGASVGLGWTSPAHWAGTALRVALTFTCSV